MIIDFAIHNLFKRSRDLFENEDPHLFLIRKMLLVYKKHWWREIDQSIPGIFLLFGGRQTGKTTSIKLLIKTLLDKISPSNINYLACDFIRDRFELIDNIRICYDETNSDFPVWIFLDEITFIKDWEISIKALADEGLFINNFCVITGSDQILLQQARRGLVGRRGDAKKLDFFIESLAFQDFLDLVTEKYPMKTPYELFADFCRTGGYLKAINDYYTESKVSESTIKAYSDWIVGDFERLGKSARTLMEILNAILTCYATQVTYGSLLDHVQNSTKPTLIEYIEILERMKIVTILNAFDHNRKRAAPKKARKIYFADPFIFSVTNYVLSLYGFTEAARIDESKLIEGIAVCEYRRRYPCYYHKGEGEIDLVYLERMRPRFVEIKWAKQIREKDIKELKKFKQSTILSRDVHMAELRGISVKSLVEQLVNF